MSKKDRLGKVIQVEENVFWHFTRETLTSQKTFEVGKEYQIGKESNPFFHYMLDNGFEYENVYTSEYINENEEALLADSQLLYALAQPALQEMTIRIRELVLELIRVIHLKIVHHEGIVAG